MIENKRFTYENHKVKDNLTGETHSSNMVSVNVLNEIHEENEQLKSDKESLIDFIKMKFPKSYKHILEGFE